METKKELTAQQKIFVIKRARTLMKLVSEIEIEFPGRDERDLKVMREGFASWRFYFNRKGIKPNKREGAANI